MNRREMLASVGAGIASVRTLLAQQQKPEFTALDHIEFYVSDVEKSRDFFVKIFGNTLLKNRTAAKRYLKMGSTYMAFEAPRGSDGRIQVDHFSIAIKQLQM